MYMILEYCLKLIFIEDLYPILFLNCDPYQNQIIARRKNWNMIVGNWSIYSLMLIQYINHPFRLLAIVRV